MRDEGKAKKTKPWTPQGAGAKSLIRRTDTDDLQVMMVDSECKLAMGTNDGGVTFWCRAYNGDYEGTASRYNLENAVIAAVKMLRAKVAASNS